jgi:carbon monoxide dehydrogenase subunit G
MELNNEFRVGVPIEQAYEVLTDVERIAPCMPGAQLQEVEGEEYRGVVKVKVGPITANYKGAATFLEREAPTRVMLRAEGRETRGQGNANATITATMDPDGDGTKVAVVTDLTVTGRVAQFGRGVLADVSSKLLGQFVDCLEGKLGEDTGASGGAAPSTPAPVATGGAGDIASEGAAATARLETPPTPSGSGEPASSSGAAGAEARLNGTSGPAVRVVDSPEAEPVDLLDAAGVPVAKRIAPAVVGLTILWLLSIFIRRRRRKR